MNYHHTYPFALNRIAQSSPLFTVLGEGPIRDKIMGYVLRDHFDAASFGLSCREALGALISQIVSTPSRPWSYIGTFIDEFVCRVSGTSVLVGLINASILDMDLARPTIQTYKALFLESLW